VNEVQLIAPTPHLTH